MHNQPTQGISFTADICFHQTTTAFWNPSTELDLQLSLLNHLYCHCLKSKKVETWHPLELGWWGWSSERTSGTKIQQKTPVLVKFERCSIKPMQLWPCKHWTDLLVQQGQKRTFLTPCSSLCYSEAVPLINPKGNHPLLFDGRVF